MLIPVVEKPGTGEAAILCPWCGSKGYSLRTRVMPLGRRCLDCECVWRYEEYVSDEPPAESEVRSG